MKLILRKEIIDKRVNYIFIGYYTDSFWDSLGNDNYVVVKVKEERFHVSIGKSQNSTPIRTAFDNPARQNMVSSDDFVFITPECQQSLPLDDIKVIDYLEVGRGPNGNKSSGKIKYIAGLRYIDIGGGVLERFSASNEPFSIDGEYFTGNIGVEVYIDSVGDEKTHSVYTHTNDSGEYIESDNSTLVRKKETLVSEIKTVATDVTKNTKKTVKIDKKELDSLKELASGVAVSQELESNDFDESGFLDDLSESELRNSCSIAGDKLTLSVIYSGAKYQKRFKSESIASRQYEMISSALSSNALSIKELFEGDVATFMKIT